MSYKEKAATGGEYRGGALTVHDKPARPRYACFASQCPMPGTIFGGDSKAGACAWHYGIVSTDIPRVTQVLKDWGPVCFEIDECRRVLTDSETAFDPKAQNALYANAVERIRSFVQAGGWGEQFEANGRDYRTWGYHLEGFIGGRVVEVLSTHRRTA